MSDFDKKAEVAGGSNLVGAAGAMGTGLSQAKIEKASPEDQAHATLKAAEEHRHLAMNSTISLACERRHFQPSWNALAETLFHWFRHQGFWPKDYGPQIAKSGNADDAYITLTRAEYTRLKKAEKIALIHSELSELLEAVRKDDWANEAEEMADVEVRVLDYCGGFGIDLGEGFYAKMLKNFKRPFRHGKGF